MSRWSVVVPTCRPDSLAEFLAAWKPLFQRHDVDLHVVYDDPGGWAGRPAFIPQRTDMCRSWGIYEAWQHGAEFTLSLDDDVRPIADVDVFDEYERVFDAGLPFSKYLNVGQLTTAERPMRGFPKHDRILTEVAVQYGGWDGMLDYDADTQLAGVRENELFGQVIMPVPVGAAVTGCAMNMAWRTKEAPLMWQLPLHEGRYNRFGDIWAGLLAKKTLDFEGRVVAVNGRASVLHERASDPVANQRKEAPGVPVNEGLWQALRPGTYRTVTDSAFRYFAKIDADYADTFEEARDEWLNLFETADRRTLERRPELARKPS